MSSLMAVAVAVPRKSGRKRIDQKLIPLLELGMTAIGGAVVLTPEEHERITPDFVPMTLEERLTALCCRVRPDALTFREFLAGVDRLGMGKSWDLRYLIRVYTAAQA